MLNLLTYLAIFSSLLFPYRDKDWGWHYRYGEYLLTQGQIMVKDIYTWTMSGYAWTNHSWLFDPILYLLSKFTGFTGLAVIGAIISFICFLLLTKKYRLLPLEIATAGLFFVKLIEVGVRDGLRSQSLALLPLALTIYLVTRIKQSPQLLALLPPLFVLWSNLHGTFVYGIFIVAVFFAVYFWQFPRLRLKLFIIGFLTLLSTLFNPFGYHPYLEVIRHTNSPYLRNVFEWMPLELSCDYCRVPTLILYLITLLLAALSLPFATSLPYLILGFVLIILTLGARRYLPLFTISTFPLLLEYLVFLRHKYHPETWPLGKYLLVLTLVVTLEYNLFTRLPSFNFYRYSEYDYCYLASRCSPDLVTYLTHNPPVGFGLNFYDWGGYLIGRQVPFKLFVDGRMHLWQGKGYTAFGDYIEMYYHLNAKMFNNYAFDWLLIDANSGLAQHLRTSKDLGSWQVKYQDDYSLYLTRQPQ